MSLEKPDWSAIPAPDDDGAADHLTGKALPSLILPASDGTSVHLSHLPGLVVFYLYPMTGRPDCALPDGWDQIPGARGCTPQSCSFRDHFADLQALGVGRVYGVSTQDRAWQKEAAERLHLPFPLLSDRSLSLKNALGLPTFQAEGMTLLKRMSWIVRDGVIEKVFYPIFPPDMDAPSVIAHLQANSEGHG